VRLTPAGEAFLARAERVLADVDAAGLEVREFSGSYLLPPVLAGFRRLHPGVQVGLREEDSATLVELTRRGEVDVSLVTPAGDAPDLEIIPLLTEPLLLAVPPDHRLAPLRDIGLRQIAGEPFILLKEGMGFRHVVLEACAAAGIAPRVVFESSDLETVQSLVAAGMGVTLVPRMTAQAVRTPAPAFLPLRPPVPTRTLSLAWRRDRHRSRASRGFVDLMQETWRRRPPAPGPPAAP
jgi:LysR family hydrogen peroxide-inducible transcriptional activator